MSLLSWPPAPAWQAAGWQVAALFACVAAVAAAAYWLGFQHGSASKKIQPSVPPESRLAPAVKITREAFAPSPHIPPYRVNELTVLMELGVLTQEEFEHEKGKLHAGR